MRQRLLKTLGEVIGVIPDEEEKEGLTKSEMYRMLYRNQFSKYLFYGYYDEELGVYYNRDDTIGILLEGHPVLFFSSESLHQLQIILKSPYPEGSVLQVMCFADPDVRYYVRGYLESKKKAPSFVRKAYESLVDYYVSGKSGFPIRNFRVIISLKFPAKEVTKDQIRDIKNSLIQGFIAAKVPVTEMTPDRFVSFMRNLFNDRDKLNEESEYNWCNYTPLSKQIILAETEIKKENKYLLVGSKYFRCISPKTLPGEFVYYFSNFLTGSYEGVSGDFMQISSPFFICVTVILKDQKMAIHSKANLIFQQQAFGSFIASLQRKKDEYLWALDKVESGERFYPVIITIWLYDTDRKRLDESLYKAVKIWESTGCVMQEDSILALPLFVYSLPMNFTVDNKTLLFLDRHFILPTDVISYFLPLQVDFRGTDEPALLFVGRKGQLIGLDIFSKKSPNANFFVAAPSGKGKSFLVNYIVANYLGMGVKVRIIDIGGSYRKLCKMFGGNYIDFSPDSNICINLFENIKDPQYDIPVITGIIAHMAAVYTGELPGRVSRESAYNIISAAVNSVIRTRGADATIDDVYEYLSTFPKYFEDYDLLCSEEKPHCEEDFSLAATHLAFNLYKFTSSGAYGKWFVGKTTFDISKDDLVVLELEHLKPLKDLFHVISLVVMNAVSTDLYLSDRSTPRLIILDEAWQFLQDTKAYQEVIEEGYRRARKYMGSFGIVTQSVLDLEGFGRVGQVINTNTAFKFYLESGDFARAAEKKLLPIMDEFTLRLLSTVRYNAPYYSEIFVYSDRFGSGVMRLMVDPYSYYIYTSNPRDIVAIESLVESGLTYEEAIEELLKRG